MSVEQAKAFAEKALKDPAILEKLSSDGADVVAIAKEHGHEFDEEHIEAGQAHLESLTDEMSEEELDDLAGGGGYSTNPVKCIHQKFVVGDKGINKSTTFL